MIFKDIRMTVRVHDWSYLKSIGRESDGHIMFGPIPSLPEIPDCHGYAVPSSWKDSVCGKDMEVWATAKEGWFCRTETGEPVHGRWIDWKLSDHIPDSWKNAEKDSSGFKVAPR